METKKTTSILPGVIYTQLKDTFTFKEITETEELEKAFRLRYEVYSESENCVLIKQNPQKADINIYDLHSKHFGLFTENNELIGYFRIVLKKENFFNLKVSSIVNAFGLNTTMKNSNQAAYPFLGFNNVPNLIKSQYNLLIHNNEGIIEAGRLAIKKSHRGLRTTSFLIEAAIALNKLICSGNKHAVILCSKEHAKFYSRYGFRPFGNGGAYDVCGTMKIAVWLPPSKSLSQSPIPTRFHSKFQDLVDEFSKTGKITRAL